MNRFIRSILAWSLALCPLATAARAQDGPSVNVPTGMVSYFTQSGSSQCPDGWQIATYAVGYVALPVANPSQAGISAGDPLQNMQVPVHAHGYDGNAPVNSHKSASGSGSRSGIIQSGDHSISGTSTSDSINYPLVQFAVCEAVETSGTDDVPVGSASFFSPQTQACPDGWAASPYTGYFPMPANNLFPIGTANGTPITVTNNTINLPTHQHSFSSTIDVGSISFVGMAGTSHAKGGASPVQVTAQLGDNTTPVLPTVALLMCIKTGITSQSSNMPLGMSVFFSASTCPANFGIAPASSGNFIVGIDDAGSQAATFGGQSIAWNQQGMPTHSHTISSSDTVDLGNNSTWEASGNDYTFGKGGSYSYGGPTGSTEVALPYAPLMLCSVIAQDEAKPAAPK